MPEVQLFILEKIYEHIYHFTPHVSGTTGNILITIIKFACYYLLLKPPVGKILRKYKTCTHVCWSLVEKEAKVPFNLFYVTSLFLQNLKRQKIISFLMFSEGIKKRPVTWDGLILLEIIILVFIILVIDHLINSKY